MSDVFDRILYGDSAHLRERLRAYLLSIPSDHREEFLIGLCSYLVDSTGDIRYAAVELISRYIRKADPLVSEGRAFDRANEEFDDLLGDADEQEAETRARRGLPPAPPEVDMDE
jgi:hypothetical protein